MFNFYYARVSLFIQPEDLVLEPLHVRTLEIVLLVLLLKQRHVLVNLAAFVLIELLTHARQRLKPQRVNLDFPLTVTCAVCAILRSNFSVSIRSLSMLILSL